MKTLKSLCTPRPSVFDASKRDTVLSLIHLADGKIDPDDFFEENYVTQGMRTLLIEAFRRLQGDSDQAIFMLTQAMGGGKTHNLITLGMLARHPSSEAASSPNFRRQRHSVQSGLSPLPVVKVTRPPEFGALSQHSLAMRATSRTTTSRSKPLGRTHGSRSSTVSRP